MVMLAVMFMCGMVCGKLKLVEKMYSKLKGVLGWIKGLVV